MIQSTLDILKPVLCAFFYWMKGVLTMIYINLEIEETKNEVLKRGKDQAIWF